MTDPSDSQIEHITHPNGIHEFVLKEYGMNGANIFMDALEALYKVRKPSDPPLMILVVNGSGALPINYSLQRGKELTDKYPNVGKLRIALISDSAFEARLVDSFMRLMRFQNMKMRFFDVARRADADQWLLQNN